MYEYTEYSYYSLFLLYTCIIDIKRGYVPCNLRKIEAGDGTGSK